MAVIATVATLSYKTALQVEAVSAAPIAHWKFDEGTGTSAADSSGNGHTGTLTNGPTWPSAVFKTGVSFDGVNDHVLVSGGGGLNNLQSGTISFWVKWTGTQDQSVNSFGPVASRQQNQSFSNQIIGLNGSNPATARVTWQPYSPGAPAITGSTAVGDGTWRHVVVTYASGEHKLYLDGKLDGSSTTTGTIQNNSTTPLAIGAWIGDGAGFSTSVIDDFRVYNSVLTAEDVQELAAAPGGVAEGLALWLRADKGVTGNPVTAWADYSGADNDTTAFNSPSFVSNGINFNPAINLDPGTNTTGQIFRTNTTSLIGSNNAYTKVAAIKMEGTGELNNIISSGGSGTHALWGSTTGGNDLSLWHSGNFVTSTNTLVTGQPQLVSGRYGAGTNPNNVSINGTDVASEAATVRTFVDTGFTTQLGRHANTTGSDYDGHIAEAIVYRGYLSNTDLNKVNSYLALKYGTTLAHNYIASDGTTTLWDTTANSTYSNDIAGIGRDDRSALNQKQSKSVNDNTLVTIGHGSIATTNADNANNFGADKTFMVWGHNNAATTETGHIAGTEYTRMARIWKVEETGTIGTVMVRIPASAFAGEEPVLIRSTDATFGSSDTYHTLTANGSNYEATLDFGDGNFFTFASQLAGVSITESSGATSVTEGGATDTIEVTLTKQPTSDVTVSFTNDTSDLQTINSLTFTAANWNIPQIVTIAALDDNTIEGAHTDHINWSTTSTATAFSGLSKDNAVTVSVTDNDAAGATVTTTDGLTGEDGDTGQFCIKLTAQPTGDVTIALSSSNTAEVTVPASITIAAANWNADTNCVTATGVDDSPPVGDGTQSVTITTGNVTSTDANFNALDGSTIDNVTMQNQNNDPPGVSVTTVDSTTGEDGSTATVRFSLLSQPLSGADVTIPLSLSDTSEGSLGGVTSITITNANWNTPTSNEVTITGVNDDLDDGDIAYDLITGDPTSTDANYDALTAADVANPSLTNTDNDTPAVTITESSSSTDVAEGGATDTIAVALTTQPAPGNVVVVNVQPNAQVDLGSGAGVAIQLSFNNTDWNVSKDVTVTANDDTSLEGDHTALVTFSIDATATTENGYDGLSLPTVTPNITDNDTATASVSTTTHGDEAGPVSIVYTVTLSKANATGSAITFDINPSGGTATAADDYTNFTGQTISVPNGFATGTFSVTVVDDDLLEGDETVQATISNSSFGAVTIDTATATANITENDNAPLTVTATDVTAGEAPPDNGTFTVQLAKVNRTGAPITVTYAISGTATAGSDYAALSGSVEIPDGADSATILVNTFGFNDSTVEGNETVIVTLTGGSHSNTSLGSPVAATVTITDDDKAPVTDSGDEANGEGEPLSRQVDDNENENSSADQPQKPEEEEAPIGDGDDIPDEEEDKANNNGDGNGDGILDKNQASVASIMSPVTNKPITLEIKGGDCQAVKYFTVINPNDLDKHDSGYRYPHGLFDYELLCSKGGESADISLYFDAEYNEAWVWRKFNRFDNVYATLGEQDVKFATAQVGSSRVTTASYQVTDGGPYDEDGQANGAIIDPAGPSIKISSWWQTWLWSLLLIPILFLLLWRRRRKDDKDNQRLV